MPNQKVLMQKLRCSGLKLRSLLLALQIILPFLLYFFLLKGWSAASYFSAGLLALSMVIILWQK